MANKSLFSSIKSKLPRAKVRNEAGGAAYALAPKHALAQLAATGCFGNTYYATAETQLDELRKLIDQVDDNVYLAKLAVYARERAYMKDMPGRAKPARRTFGRSQPGALLSGEASQAHFWGYLGDLGKSPHPPAARFPMVQIPLGRKIAFA